MGCPEKLPLSLCMGTCGSFKHWDTGDVSGEKKKENLFTLGEHPGCLCGVGCSRGGNTGKLVSCSLGCHKCLFLSLPVTIPLL